MSLDKEPLQLNDDFQYVLDVLEHTERSIFITGKAGTGKSTLLRLFRKTTKKKYAVLAPTGIAALNVGGQTIHSFFGFPARMLTSKDIKKRKNHKLYKALKVLVIDEISMVRADLLDSIDLALRKNRENPLPFGGVQMIFFGDLFQLPPVVASETEQHFFQTVYDSPYFFSAKVFEQGFEMEKVELRQTYRQQSRHFIRLLDAVRLNRIDWEDLEDLNEQYKPDFKATDNYITLSARNATVDGINIKQLKKLQNLEYTYLAKLTGDFNPRLFPTDPALKLKVGAQVMFVKNDPKRQFVNGTIGTVMELEEDNVTVAVQDNSGKSKWIELEKMTWEILKYTTKKDNPNEIDTEVVGSFEQFPLKLAWAITIHKSQGQTFDKVIIDMQRGAFEHGQTYVALSRCRTLEGIILKKPLDFKDVMVDDRIVEYYEQHF